MIDDTSDKTGLDLTPDKPNSDNKDSPYSKLFMNSAGDKIALSGSLAELYSLALDKIYAKEKVTLESSIVNFNSAKKVIYQVGSKRLIFGVNKLAVENADVKSFINILSTIPKDQITLVIDKEQGYYDKCGSSFKNFSMEDSSPNENVIKHLAELYEIKMADSLNDALVGAVNALEPESEDESTDTLDESDPTQTEVEPESEPDNEEVIE